MKIFSWAIAAKLVMQLIPKNQEAQPTGLAVAQQDHLACSDAAEESVLLGLGRGQAESDPEGLDFCAERLRNLSKRLILR